MTETPDDQGKQNGDQTSGNGQPTAPNITQEQARQMWNDRLRRIGEDD